MVRGGRIGKAAAALAVLGCLALPVSNASAGTLVNYVSTSPLKIGQKIEIVIVCSANCNVNSTSILKGPHYKQKVPVSGGLLANQPGGPFFQPNSALLKAMKASPSKFRIVNTVTATDATTGATDAISRTFRLTR